MVMVRIVAIAQYVSSRPPSHYHSSVKCKEKNVKDVSAAAGSTYR